jgi:ArsR family transcriptional regulator
MDMQTTQPESLLRWMASLADATRLRLLRLVERHELAVSDLCEVLQLPQSTVSRHLKLLGDEGWTVNRRRGTTNLYRMVLDELEPAQRQMWVLAREQTEGWAAVGQDQVRVTQRLRQRSEAGQSFFAGAADQWDKLRTEMYGPTFGTDALLALLPSDWTVADLGCGTGALTLELSRHVKQAIGVDNTPAMLDAGRRRTGEARNIDLREGDLEALPIEDGLCDAALMVLVLTYLDHPAQALGEMTRILKPGGRAVIVDVMRHDRDDFRRQMGQQNMGYEANEVCTLLTDAGLTSATCSPITPHPQAKGPALLLATANKPKEA